MAFVVNIYAHLGKEGAELRPFSQPSLLWKYVILSPLPPQWVSRPSVGQQCPGCTDEDSAQESPRRPQSRVLSSLILRLRWSCDDTTSAQTRPPPNIRPRETRILGEMQRGKIFLVSSVSYWWIYFEWVRFDKNMYVDLNVMLKSFNKKVWWSMIIHCNLITLLKTVWWNYNDAERDWGICTGRGYWHWLHSNPI